MTKLPPRPGEIQTLLNSARPSLAPLPAECHSYRPRHTVLGYPEQHQCPECGEPMGVCDNCGGDYHELAEQRSKCPSKRLNNRTIAIDYEGLEANLREMAKRVGDLSWHLFWEGDRVCPPGLPDHRDECAAFADEIASRRNRE